MKIGVVYAIHRTKAINGSLFYGYEYCQMLRQQVDARLYLVGVSPTDISLITSLFETKYTVPCDCIVPVASVDDLHKLRFDKTLVLDVNTFYLLREYFTNEVHCYSNGWHQQRRYDGNRTVTFYGEYDYQPRDVTARLCLNFSIFRTHSGAKSMGTYVCSGDMSKAIPHLQMTELQHPVHLKHPFVGRGDIFELVSNVHYIHVGLDKNNRSIPEGFFHGKNVTYQRISDDVKNDSSIFRYLDIQSNGLEGYTLTEHDPLITAML